MTASEDGAQHYAVIGSGLGAVSAAKVLVQKGIKPVIFDVGIELDENRQRFAENLSAISPEKWTVNQREKISENSTLRSKKTLPKKLVFGSDYFYGKGTSQFPVGDGNGEIPPFSYAVGGMSAGWGAAVLLPRDEDLMDWPLSMDDLKPYAKTVLDDLPYSAKLDRLDQTFPILKNDPSPLKLSSGEQRLLDKLLHRLPNRPNRINVGQSRLMVRAKPADKKQSKTGNKPLTTGCNYCGECMSGCVYGNIYKSSDDLKHLISKNLVDYRPGIFVTRVAQNDEQIEISFVKNEKTETQTFKKVFLGAGAVNSTRIFLDSIQCHDQKIKLKSRAGFVIPFFSLSKIGLSWPMTNTQPSIFLEFLLKRGSSRHWVHNQISMANEIILRKINVNERTVQKVGPLKSFALNRMVVAFGNMSSELADDYLISVTKPATKTNSEMSQLQYERKLEWRHRRSALKAMLVLSWHLLKVGCLPILPFARINRLAFHVGGTLPMKAEPENQLETDMMCCPKGWRNLHFVDSCTFPSLPGTTIGLLIMANARRVVDSTVDKNSG